MRGGLYAGVAGGWAALKLSRASPVQLSVVAVWAMSLTIAKREAILERDWPKAQKLTLTAAQRAELEGRWRAFRENRS